MVGACVALIAHQFAAWPSLCLARDDSGDHRTRNGSPLDHFLVNVYDDVLNEVGSTLWSARRVAARWIPGTQAVVQGAVDRCTRSNSNEHATEEKGRWGLLFIQNVC